TPDPIKARCESGHVLFFLVFNLQAAATAAPYARHSIFAPAFPRCHTRPYSCYGRPAQRCPAPSRPGPFLENPEALLFFLLSDHQVPGQQEDCLPRCSRKCLHDPWRLLASIAAPSFRCSHTGTGRCAASGKAGFNIRRGNQVASLRRRPRLLDLLRQPGIVLLCFFLLGHVTAHEVAKKLGSGTVMGFGGIGKFYL